MTSPSRRDRGNLRRMSLSVSLIAAGRETDGELQDLSVKGCCASFPKSGLPALEAGQVARLEFRGLLLLEPLCAQAAVKSRTADGDRVLLALEFIDPESVQRNVPYVLLAEFNRRTAPRVPIDDVVEVTVQSLGIEDPALLLEVSTGGVGLRISNELARQLTPGDRLELSFRLPEHPEGFHLLGMVRGLRPSGDWVGCSIQFDEAATADFERQREALERIVDRRRKSTPPVPEP